MKILQLKIELNDITPKIWRRFLVKDSITFRDLHNTIQIIMGWEDYHLYEFCIDNKTITSEEEGYNPAESSLHKLTKSSEFIKTIKEQDINKESASLDINKMNKILKKIEKNKPKNSFNINIPLSKLIKSKNQKLTYLYDFGDNWMHKIIVEKIINDKEECPICLEGERACPPEDCGSVPGYYELLDLKENKKHPDYKERIVEWLGENHDFEHFNVQEINKELKKEIKESLEEKNLWEDNTFFETLGPIEIKKRMKTFQKKHDEDMNYNCRKCNKKISAHNKDWHDNLCDECFNKK